LANCEAELKAQVLKADSMLRAQGVVTYNIDPGFGIQSSDPAGDNATAMLALGVSIGLIVFIAIVVAGVWYKKKHMGGSRASMAVNNGGHRANAHYSNTGAVQMAGRTNPYAQNGQNDTRMVSSDKSSAKSYVKALYVSTPFTFIREFVNSCIYNGLLVCLQVVIITYHSIYMLLTCISPRSYIHFSPLFPCFSPFCVQVRVHSAEQGRAFVPSGGSD
jgi:hypothetical protein